MFSRLVLAVVLFAGCTPGICGRASDCATGLVCTAAGACVLPPTDGGTSDTTTTMVEDAATTPVRDGDPDAFQIEPIDAAVIDSSGNTIDAPDDNGVRGAR